MDKSVRHRNTSVSPWAWVSTLYFAEAMPYVAVMTLSVLMYKVMGVSNGEIAFYTSWLYLPWVIKPLWSPFVDIFRTKLWWIVTTEALIAVGLACVAFTLPGAWFFQLSLAFFWLTAFVSATHDIAADGFYMLALTEHQQAFYVGIRSTFYRIATIFSQGGLVALAWVIGESGCSVATSWGIVMGVISVSFFIFAVYHRMVLPRPACDRPAEGVTARNAGREFLRTFATFFRKPHALTGILFMLLYRLPEAQLVKLINPFLVDGRDVGGLGLTTGEVGLVYGTVGVIGLTVGGIVGGLVVSRGGLRRWLWPMAWGISLTCITFCYLAWAQPTSLFVICTCVGIEQLGYGFGFSAYMLYLIYYSEGELRTAHYAICTGFMALGMMLPGMAAGWIQEHLGYEGFFWWVMGCCAVTIAVTALIRVPAEFGRKHV
ncbi:MFS transporter [uncultured Muribaculum sp.]|uniref:MFS transporter n=1 Tax=uncultured Muribaculum sp. TaxID=1918613 RepID=UPI00263487E9|nr:MFS transporter [uncultured Muribaculum sp.]